MPFYFQQNNFLDSVACPFLSNYTNFSFHSHFTFHFVSVCVKYVVPGPREGQISESRNAKIKNSPHRPPPWGASGRYNSGTFPPCPPINKGWLRACSQQREMGRHIATKQEAPLSRCTRPPQLISTQHATDPSNRPGPSSSSKTASITSCTVIFRSFLYIPK